MNNTPASLKNNQAIKSYDIVFIGGGPSTISFLSYIFKNKLLDKAFDNTSILIIEKSETFGSGCLAKYGINSNTSSEGFVRLISLQQDNSKVNKYALSPPKNINQGQNNTKNDSSSNKVQTPIKNQSNEAAPPNSKNTYIPCSIFQELFNTKPVQTLLKLANNHAPLSLVGYFLDCIGNFMADYIYKHFTKNILMLNTEVFHIKMTMNDEFFLSTQNTKTKLSSLIKCKNLVLATGGKQRFQQKITTEILKYKTQSEFMHSDYVLQEEGFNNLITTLNLKPKKKVVIIGGSHSGFSCAWILLNKPSSYKDIMVTSGPDYKIKYDIFCNNCRENSCCFGKIVDRNWHKVKSLELKDHEKIEISILYKDHIKVYYSSEKEALNDGYNIYNPKEAVNKNGNVYPFIGIRGDAKALYRSIVKNKESRVKLVKTKDFQEQLKYIESASVVIWACGYTTNNINIFNYRNNKIDFLEDGENGPFEVNKELRILDSFKHPVKNLYGIGQGYSTFSIELINDKKGRADSINLYNTYIAKKLYKSLEPVFEKKDTFVFDNPRKETVGIIPVAKKEVVKENTSRMNLNTPSLNKNENSVGLASINAKINSTPKRIIEKSKENICSSNNNSSNINNNNNNLVSQTTIHRENSSKNLPQPIVLSNSREIHKPEINRYNSPPRIIKDSSMKAPVNNDKYLVNVNQSDNSNKQSTFNQESLKFNNVLQNSEAYNLKSPQKINYNYRMSNSNQNHTNIVNNSNITINTNDKKAFNMNSGFNKNSVSLVGIKPISNNNTLSLRSSLKNVNQLSNSSNISKKPEFLPPPKSNILMNSIDNHFLKGHSKDNEVNLANYFNKEKQEKNEKPQKFIIRK